MSPAPRRALAVSLLAALDACTPTAVVDAPPRDATIDATSDVPAASDVPDAPAVPDVPDATIDVPDAHDATPDVPDAPPALDRPVLVDVPPALDLPVLVDVPPAVDVPDVVDVPPAPSLASLGGCLGASASLTIARQAPYLSVAVGDTRGEFLLDYASTFSSIDLAAFPSPGPRTSGCDPGRLGESCAVAGFAFFATPSTVTLVTEDFRSLTGLPRQAGIIGTDFLSLRTIALSYARAIVFVASGAPCTDAAWRSVGLVPLPTDGFFSHDLGALSPFSRVDPAATTGHVPNVPTVPIRIAGAAAVAQLDTGFDDARVPLSVNVNEALYRAVVARDPTALLRAPARDLSLSTCVVGVSEPVEAYSLREGVALEFLGEGAAVARRARGVTLFVKRTPAAARPCGGIGTWTVPAAQVAASFFVAMGTLVFDPYSARVWVPSDP